MNEEMRQMATLVKEINKEIPVVVGGAHPSSLPEYVLRNNSIDFVVVGEGETTFSELIKILSLKGDLKRIDGLMYKEHGTVIQNAPRKFIEDLNSLPFPAWHLLPLESYISIGQAHGAQRKKRFAPLITSRGCPGKCVFCSIHSVWGYKWRPRSPENIVAEIERLVSSYGIQEFHFEDDNLTLSKNRMIEMCDLILKKGLNIKWMTPNGVAVNTLDQAVLKKMKESGCFQLNFGIESGDPIIQKEIINKPLNLERVQNIINYSKKLGIWTHGFFVIGFPDESVESIRKTIEFSKNADLDSADFFIAAPYPDTKCYSKSRSVTEEFDLSKLRTMDASINTAKFSAEELVALQKKAYMEFIFFRAQKEFLYGYFFARLLRNRSTDDLAFFIQKISKRVIPTIMFKN